MFHRTLIFGALVVVIACGRSGASGDDAKSKGWIHAPLDKLLGDLVAAGVVDYAGMKKREAELDRYLKALAGAKPSKMTRDGKLAYWINAYNAFTLKLILTHYPKVTSITKLEKPWDTKSWKAGGETYTLNDIEHRIIRKEFAEPRIHFALVCAATSCPDLASYAYSAKKLNAQLADRTKAFLGDRSKGLRVTRTEGGKGVIALSALFKWYGEDFETAKGSVIDYVLPHLPVEDREYVKKHRKALKVEYLPYDWSLNGR